ncbi:MAG: prepilin-type N-terminal cleavage/methylation domain-containing protein [Desulfobacteraceae bacterium]|jgi:prepilin-type N-terminal cleavage/methylation domain-containing protein
MFMRKNDEKGFTLIELMIVIAIIGILAAIAIPNFNAYRARSYNAAANSDIKNMITAQEGYYIDHDVYATASGDLQEYGYTRSDGVIIGDVTATNNTVSYQITGVYNEKAADRATNYSVTGPGGTIQKY